MSKLTLDEAIKHCLEVVEKNEQAKKDGNLWIDTEYEDCCTAHRQLAEWLTELKQLKAIIAGYGTVDMQKLDMILAMIRTESEGAWTRIEREKELAEAKRLLKLALQDLAEADHCGLCKHEPDDIVTCQRKPINCFVWRYADEAEKLLNG